MAEYRCVKLAFWEDNLVQDEFTPEDKYFYLYLLTNPSTNLLGCYEYSNKRMALELGYNDETVKKLLARFKNQYKLIDFDESTKEILILNWGKNNWNTSPKYQAGVVKEITSVKSETFKQYLITCLEQLQSMGYISVSYFTGEIEEVLAKVTKQKKVEEKKEPEILTEAEEFERDKNKKDPKTLMHWTNVWIQNKDLQDALIEWLKQMIDNRKFQSLSCYKTKLQELLNSTSTDDEAVIVVKTCTKSNWINFDWAIKKKEKKGYRL